MYVGVGGEGSDSWLPTESRSRGLEVVRVPTLMSTLAVSGFKGEADALALASLAPGLASLAAAGLEVVRVSAPRDGVKIHYLRCWLCPFSIVVCVG